MFSLALQYQQRDEFVPGLRPGINRSRFPANEIGSHIQNNCGGFLGCGGRAQSMPQHRQSSSHALRTFSLRDILRGPFEINHLTAGITNRVSIDTSPESAPIFATTFSLKSLDTA